MSKLRDDNEEAMDRDAEAEFWLYYDDKKGGKCIAVLALLIMAGITVVGLPLWMLT
jgi:hypothetical protein